MRSSSIRLREGVYFAFFNIPDLQCKLPVWIVNTATSLSFLKSNVMRTGWAEPWANLPHAISSHNDMATQQTLNLPLGLVFHTGFISSMWQRFNLTKGGHVFLNCLSDLQTYDIRLDFQARKLSCKGYVDIRLSTFSWGAVLGVCEALCDFACKKGFTKKCDWIWSTQVWPLISWLLITISINSVVKG